MPDLQRSEHLMPQTDVDSMQTCPEHSLQSCFNALQSLTDNTDTHADGLDKAFAACAAAEPDGLYIHRVYRDIGQLALDSGYYDYGELFAIRALQSMPRYGEAFKLLGRVLLAAGRPDDAATCHRYGLPSTVRDKWFSDTACEWVDSAEVDDGSVCRLSAFPAHTQAIKPPGQWREQRIVELLVESLNIAEGYTVAASNGSLWFDTFNTVLWDEKKRIVGDACRGFAEVVNGSLGDRKPVSLSGRVCLLGNRNADNYYHWMNDVLPRLAVLVKSGFELDTIDHFIVGRLKHPFHHESMQAFGIDESRIHLCQHEEYVTGDEVIVPCYGANSLGLAQGRWAPEFLSQTFAPEAKPDQTSRLYISRGSEGARGISNESDLISFLESQDFKVVRAEGLSIREQAAMFAAAKVILGPHGAGFSNIAFCQPGTCVIELFNSHIAPCFWTLSHHMQLQHHVHFCGDFDETARPNDFEQYHRTADDRRRSPFTVNVQEIELVLRSIGVIQ